MSAKWRKFAFWAIVVVFVLWVFTLFESPRVTGPEISFSEMLNAVDQGRVRDVAVQGSQVTGRFTNDHRFQTYALTDASLIQRLHDKGVSVTVRPREETPLLISIIVSCLPFATLIAVWVWLAHKMQRDHDKI